VAAIAPVVPVVPVVPVAAVQQQEPAAAVVAQAPQVPVAPVNPAQIQSDSVANSVANSVIDAKNFQSLKIDSIVDQDAIDAEMSRISINIEKPAMKSNAWQVARDWIRPRLICRLN
jgi:hypothetical protein